MDVVKTVKGCNILMQYLNAIDWCNSLMQYLDARARCEGLINQEQWWGLDNRRLVDCLKEDNTSIEKDVISQ